MRRPVPLVLPVPVLQVLHPVPLVPLVHPVAGRPAHPALHQVRPVAPAHQLPVRPVPAARSLVPRKP